MTHPIVNIKKLRDAHRISEISYRFCEFLSRTDPNCSLGVLIAACLVSSRKEEGDVCIELVEEAGQTVLGGEGGEGITTPELEEWIQQLRSSRCVGVPGNHTPLVLDAANRLYLQKYWKYEDELAGNLLKLAQARVEPIEESRVREHLDVLFGSDTERTDWQKVAAYTALENRLTIISGGPGTGKTTTVINILVLLARMNLVNHVVLAAPTGKAAARLKESIVSATIEQQLEEPIRQRLSEEAFTIHRLLGIQKYRSGTKYNRSRPLPYDVVVIDEASMIDLVLMHKLTEALLPSARLILLGDKDQLSSVEAGAVLGSICNLDRNRFSSASVERMNRVGLPVPQSTIEKAPLPLTDRIVLLKRSYRFDEKSGIARLSSHILEGQPEQALDLLKDEAFPDVTLRTFEDPGLFRQWIGNLVKKQFERANADLLSDGGTIPGVDTGILCVHRRGPLGSEQVNQVIEHLLRKEGLVPVDREWYPGKRVMVMKNDYTLGLRNGDVGLVMQDDDGEMKVFFSSKKNGTRSCFPGRLSSVETAFAITVHKSQGSEFEHVVVILPRRVSPVMSRELLYTAVSRSVSSCTIVGSPELLKEGILRKADRASGLRDRIWNR